MTIAQRPGNRRLLTSVLTSLKLFLIALVGAGTIFAVQPFGHRIWLFGATAALLLLIGWSLHRPSLTRKAILGGLAGWIGLIAWSALSPGGVMPPPKDDPAAVRVLTWNILLGAEGGPPWRRHGWSVRKPALRAALKAAGPDILCVQEALGGQVKFLEAELPRHRRGRGGRGGGPAARGQCAVYFDAGRVAELDGRRAGEHCAISSDAGRFEELDGGTFGREEPAALPPARPALGPKRICPWVRLRDRPSGRPLRIYNPPLSLPERARQSAVRGIL